MKNSSFLLKKKIISVNVAEKKIFSNLKKSSPLPVSLRKSIGHILRENLFTPLMPPYDKVLMDGIAIDFNDWKQGTTIFSQESIQKIGKKPLTKKNKKSFIEVTTGCPLPKKTDTVIPVENINFKNFSATITNKNYIPIKGQYIQTQGSYHPKKLLLKNPKKIQTPHLATAASIGKEALLVSSTPKVAIFSIGNELIDPGQKNCLYKTYRSNSYAIESALKNDFASLKPSVFHLKDDLIKLKKMIIKTLDQFEIFILSGGVSKGCYDYTVQALKEAKVKEVFHGVKQKPGKPFWFGIGEKNQLFFALPGNPISSLILFYRYIKPALMKIICYHHKQQSIKIDKTLKGQDTFNQFILISTKEIKGHFFGTPLKIINSGNWAILSEASGFIELKKKEVLKKGKETLFYSWS